MLEAIAIHHIKTMPKVKIMMMETVKMTLKTVKMVTTYKSFNIRQLWG